jgi:hypothetical protein
MAGLCQSYRGGAIHQPTDPASTACLRPSGSPVRTPHKHTRLVGRTVLLPEARQNAETALSHHCGRSVTNSLRALNRVLVAVLNPTTTCLHIIYALQVTTSTLSRVVRAGTPQRTVTWTSGHRSDSQKDRNVFSPTFFECSHFLAQTDPGPSQTT